MPKKKNKKPKATKQPPKITDRATQYALDVVSGDILAGPFVRGSCQRHLNDLEHGAERGLYYDKEAAAYVIDFFETILKLNGGQFEGLPFILFPWEAFIIGSLFGWKVKKTGFRRFRLAYIETGKGSGKTPMAYGVSLFGLIADDEPRAEIYSCATYQVQAMIGFRDACAFVDQSPQLNSRLKMSGAGEKRWNIYHPESKSFFRVISSEKKGQAGPRPHMYVADELFEHRDGTVVSILEKGFKFRRQPLGIEISNSGSDVHSFCYERHEMCRKISLGFEENDDIFSYVCALDEEDIQDKNGEESEQYLDNEKVWVKVNPSIEYGLPGYEYIRKEVKKARGMPSQMALVKQLNFCQWVAADNPWLSGDLWFGCQRIDGFDDESLRGRKCWGGLDLSSTQDLTALALVFEPCTADPVWRLKVFFWIPGDDLIKKEDQDHVKYTVWRDKGHITALPGKAVNKSSVVKLMSDIALRFNLQGIAYDRARIKDLFEFGEKAGIELTLGKWDKEKRQWDFERGDGIKMMPFGQESKSMEPAISKFEGMLIDKQILHNGNPALNWCAANAITIADEDMNRRLSKKKSTGRIDGIVAAIMAVGVAESNLEGIKSRYEDPDEKVIAI